MAPEWPNFELIQVVPLSGQICNSYKWRYLKWRHLVAKCSTPMQIAHRVQTMQTIQTIQTTCTIQAFCQKRLLIIPSQMEVAPLHCSVDSRLQNVSLRAFGAKDVTLFFCWWGTDKELMKNWWRTDEKMMRTDEELMKNWWRTNEDLMNNWWRTDEELMKNE